MELRHIRYFLAVKEAGNLSRAAEAVGIGQPPLSLQIKALEDEIGARLFHRVPKGVTLTAAGQAFFNRVQNLPAQAAEAASAARRAARGELGELRVGFTASAAFNPAVTHAIRRFRRGYPGVELVLTEANTYNLTQELQADTLDAAFLRPGDRESRARCATACFPKSHCSPRYPRHHRAGRRQGRGPGRAAR